MNGWLIYLMVLGIIALLAVPLKFWPKLWVAGVASTLCILLVDGTLESLRAFQFTHSGLRIGGLPIPYWISYFFGGIVYAYYRPTGKGLQALYVLGFSIVLCILECIMILLGLFKHVHWTLLHSILIDIFGFLYMLCLYEWLGIAQKATLNPST